MAFKKILISSVALLKFSFFYVSALNGEQLEEKTKQVQWY